MDEKNVKLLIFLVEVKKRYATLNLPIIYRKLRKNSNSTKSISLAGNPLRSSS